MRRALQTPYVDEQKIGAFLKKIREEAGVIQPVVAEDLGSTVAYVSNIERGRSQLTLRVVLYYSEKFGYPVQSIVNAGLEEPFENEKTALDARIVKLIQTLPKEEQEKVVYILKYWKQ